MITHYSKCLVLVVIHSYATTRRTNLTSALCRANSWNTVKSTKDIVVFINLQIMYIYLDILFLMSIIIFLPLLIRLLLRLRGSYWNGIQHHFHYKQKLLVIIALCPNRVQKLVSSPTNLDSTGECARLFIEIEPNLNVSSAILSNHAPQPVEIESLV